MALVGVLALVVLIAGFWIAFQFVEPAPPKSITIASGGKGGASPSERKAAAPARWRSGSCPTTISSERSRDRRSAG